MAVIVGAAIGAGATLYGGSKNARAQKKAQRLTQAQRDAAFSYLKGSQGSDQLYAGLQEAQIKKANAASLSGFDAARKAQELGSIQARQGILDRGAQFQAQQQQSLVSQGLLGTSTGQGASQDVSGAVSQQLAGLDAQFAQTLADLNLGQGVVESQGLNRLAQHFGETRSYNQELQYELANLAPAKVKGIDWSKVAARMEEKREEKMAKNKSRSQGVFGGFTRNEDGSWSRKTEEG